MNRNTVNASLKYYKGIIRQLESRVGELLGRVSKLEKQLRAIPKISAHSPDNYELFSDSELAENIRRNQGYGEGFPAETVGGGLTEQDVIDIVSNALENATIKLPVHDHTADDKGGDCYAGLGAKLV